VTPGGQRETILKRLTTVGYGGADGLAAGYAARHIGEFDKPAVSFVLSETAYGESV
jgi:hypothetical protein